MDIYSGNPPSNWHYPPLYGFSLAWTFILGNYWFVGMYLSNIILKAIGLFWIYWLGKRLFQPKNAIFVTALIAFSPIYFIYTDFIFAENLSAPLLIITILYTWAYAGKSEIKYTALASVLGFSLYFTKWLFLALLPVLCLYWGVEQSRRLKGKIDFKFVIFRCMIYTGIVCGIILLYTLIYCLRMKGSFWTLLPYILGFESGGSSPGTIGFPIVVELKWVICYILYIILNGIILFASLLRDRRAIAIDKSLTLLIGLTSAVLIYMAARHSTYVSYNAGGLMINLVGRYCTYSIPMLALLYGTLQDDKIKKQSGTREKILIFVGLSLMVILGYLVLYQKLIWQTDDNWLSRNLGRENFAYGQWGWIFVGIVLLLVAVVIFYPSRRMISASIAVFSLAVALSCSVYDYSHDEKNALSRKAWEFILSRSERANIITTKEEDYVMLEGLFTSQKGRNVDNVMVLVYHSTDDLTIYDAGDKNNYIALTSDEIENWKDVSGTVELGEWLLVPYGEYCRRQSYLT